MEKRIRRQTIQFVIDDEVRELLNDLKTATGRSTYAEVFRDALTIHKLLVSEYEKGNDLLSHVRDTRTIPFRASARERSSRTAGS